MVRIHDGQNESPVLVTARWLSNETLIALCGNILYA
jgi:hypothetical protein